MAWHSVPRSVALSLLLAAGCSLSAQPLAFTNVTVIDATGAPAQPPATVLVEGERISAVGRKVRIPKGAQVVDALAANS